MVYNIYISTPMVSYNIFGLSEDKLQNILIPAYKNGEKNFTIAGKKYSIDKVSELKIFSHETGKSVGEETDFYLNNVNYRVKTLFGLYLPPSTLKKMGSDVTAFFLGDIEYGQKAKMTSVLEPSKSMFVSESRIQELSKIKSTEFDLTRLLKLCQEINDNYSNKNFLTVGMIGRTIINHVPPIFKFKSFDQVAAEYGGDNDNKSFKKNMKHLQDSLKHIADGFLHQTIRAKEVLPNETQIDFRQDLDVLMGEIVRLLK